MTSSWDNFSLAKDSPKESTTPAAPILGTTLNLASLAPHDQPAQPVAQPVQHNSLLDAGSGFVSGLGKQAVGTIDSIFGVDNALLKKNIAAGGSGVTAEGMGWMPAAGKLIHGISSTVSLAYNNPDALLKIPGQLSDQWNKGDLATKGDMAGQATFLIGSLFIGGSGAAKASKIAGDLREASVVTKGVNVLGETGTTARALETTVNGLRGSTLMGDASTIGRTSTLVNDGATLGRTAHALTDGTSLATEARFLTKGTGAMDQAASNLIRTGSYSERVLPATEGATKFLIKGETASSVGLGEISLPNRLLGLQTTESGAGVVSKFLGRFKSTTEVEPSLAATVKGVIPKLGETGTRVAEIIPTKLPGLTSEAERLAGVGKLVDTTIPAVTTEAERVAGVGKLVDTTIPAVTTEVERVAGVGKLVDTTIPAVTTEVERVAGVGKLVDTTIPAVTTDTERLAGITRAAESAAPVIKTERILQSEDVLAPHIDQFAEQVNVLRSTGNLGAHAETSFAELETGLAKFKAAGTTSERVENLGQLNRTVTALEQQGVETTALRSSLTQLQAETQTVERATQLRAATTQIAENTTTLTSQTAELSAKFGERASVQELDLATKQLAQAGSATEKAQALAGVEKATAKVVADLPAESSVALRSTVESLKAPVQFAAKSEAAELLTTQIVDRSAALTKQVSELTTTPAVRELSAATKQLSEAANATERSQAFAAVEKASAKVITEVPAETAATLRATVESLRTPVQAAARSEVAEIAATQIAERSTTLTAQTTELAAKYGSNASVQELTTATRQFNEAATASEKAQALAAVEKASVKVANDIPEAGAAVRQTVESLKAPIQTSMRAEASEVVATQIAERSSQLVSDTTQLSAKFADHAAVRELSTATKEFSQAADAVERAQAYAKVEKAANAVRDLSPEGAQVARTVESLSAPVETAARAQRIERAIAQVDESAATLTTQTRTLAQELAVEGKVPVTVRDLDNAATRLSEATSATEKAEAYRALQKSAADVATEFSGKTTQISKTIESMAPNVEAAERLTQFENVSSRVAAHADDVAQQAALLKSSSALKSEVALNELQTSATTFNAANSAEHAEQLAQMNKNLRLVEAEVGEAKVAALRTSVARLENETGTFERIAAVDKSAGQVAEQSQSVVSQAAQLQAKTTNVEVQTALHNIQLGATETGTINALNRTEQLSVRANDIAVVEREMGIAAGAQMRTAIADLDRSSAAARAASIDLVEFQGAKITQQVGYLQDGNLASHTQALRLEQLQNDVAVMKSIVPADSVVTAHLAKLEQQISGVDAIANILSHPEVARAPGKELLKLAQSSDAATATAAADRLILKGSIEKLGESPVSGLISERQQFWNTQKQLNQLEETVKSKLFESGKLFGLPSGEPIFRKTLSDIAWAAGGLLALDGTTAYNLTQLSAMARDNVLSAEAEALGREQAKKQEAEGKATEVKAAANNPQASSSQQAFAQPQSGAQPTGAQNTSAGSNTQANAQTQAGDGSMVRTAQQATFTNDSNEVTMSPVAVVYATPKFLASADTNNIPAGSFPTSGSSWWWKQQHGGNPWGFQRGPGSVAAPQEEVRQTVQITPRARGIAANPDADLTKIAPVRFPIPRVMDISNQAILLNSPNQFSSKAGRPGAISGSGVPAARSWTTVDWNQIGAQRLSAAEGGKNSSDLTKLEKDEEAGVDVAGSGTATAPNTVAVNGLNLNNLNNDPTNADPNSVDPNSVVASKQQTRDDENMAKV
jgi:hypothetical protein